MNDADFKRLLRACADVSQAFPEGVVYIGGIAVYLHAINTPGVDDLAEATHDADFYISLADMGDLRDLEEVTPNRRLSKHQLIKDGFEFDIYTERQSKLIVPYDMVAGYADVYGGVRVAGLTELFALKLDAYRDRRQSVKGVKDAKDLLRIAAIVPSGRAVDAQRLQAYLSSEHLDLLPEVARGSAPMEMARGNAVRAKALRVRFQALIDAVGGDAPRRRRHP